MSQNDLKFAVAQLRHAYQLLCDGKLTDPHNFAEGLLAPQIRHIEHHIQEDEANSQRFLRALVDWTYLHATEGQSWPDVSIADALIEKAVIGPPKQADADVMKKANYWPLMIDDVGGGP